MENKSHALAAGIFVVLLTAALAVLAIWLTRDKGSYITYEMSTSQAVTGLQQQASVRYKGVDVGKVIHIGFDRATPGNVLIRIMVDENTPVRATTYASLGYQGVTGLAYIDLDEAGASLPDLGVSDEGYKRLPMRQSSLSQLAAMGPEVISDVRETMARINSLLSEENQKLLVATIGQFGDAAKNFASLAEKIDQSWGNDIAPAVAEVSKMLGGSMKTLERTAQNIDTMSREIAKVATQLGKQGSAAVDQLGVTARSFAGTADAINASTLPKLQRTLEEMAAAIKEVSQFVRNLNDNPQSLIYGPNTSRPGPGEKGFSAP